MKEVKFYSLMSDTTIKYLFKNNKTRKVLETIIKSLTGIDLDGYELIDNELNTGSMIKDYRLDLLLRKGNNLVSIEMNRKVEDYIINKNHRYLYRLAGNIYNEGDDYKEKRYVTQINFNNAKFPIKGSSGILTYEFMNDEYGLRVEGIKSIEIYLENFKGVCYNGINLKETYLSLFTAENYEEMKKIVKDNKEVLILVEEIEKLNNDKYFGALYNVEEEQRKLENSARLTGYEQGMEIGSLSAKQGIAKSMKEDNVDIEKISIYTGLTKEEIEKL